MNIKNIVLLSWALSACAGNDTSAARKPPEPNAAPSAEQPQGTITSSGGYLYGYETNPWYLQNTVLVKYCVAIDEENFGVTKETATAEIKLAIEKWKTSLAAAKYERYDAEELKPWNEVRLGTQHFIETSCDAADVSLRFQLGVLSAEQMAKVGNPKRYVANTFETSYDEENLRGKGFIYLAPERGPLSPEEENKAEHFWSAADGSALHYVISHELGHVFGFPHSPDTIMQDDGPQLAISKNWLTLAGEYPGFRKDIFEKTTQSFFGYSADAVARIWEYHSPKFTGQDHEQELAVRCSHEPAGDSYNTQCNVYEYPDEGHGYHDIGKKIGHLSVGSSSHGGRSIDLKVKLPATQQVFILSDEFVHNNGTPSLGTIRSRTFEVSGNYVSEDGKIKFPMSVRSNDEYPAELSAIAVIDGRIVNLD